MKDLKKQKNIMLNLANNSSYRRDMNNIKKIKKAICDSLISNDSSVTIDTESS